MVENCLPGDDLDILNPYPSSLGISSNLNLSSSMSSLSVSSMHSPTDKDTAEKNGSIANSNRMRHGSANNLPGQNRPGSFKRKDSKKKVMETIENWIAALLGVGCYLSSVKPLEVHLLFACVVRKMDLDFTYQSYLFLWLKFIYPERLIIFFQDVGFIY